MTFLGRASLVLNVWGHRADYPRRGPAPLPYDFRGSPRAIYGRRSQEMVTRSRISHTHLGFALVCQTDAPLRGRA